MSILIVVANAVLGIGLIWLVQSIALRLAGEPFAWPLRFKTQKPAVRWAMRGVIHFTWILIIVITPLELGVNPLEALHKAFPLPVPGKQIALAFFVTLFSTAGMYAVWIALGWVRIEPQHDRAKRHRKLLRRLIGPVLLAAIEEAVFRGVVLEQLLQALPGGWLWAGIAIMTAAAIFAAVHFIKPRRDFVRFSYALFLAGCLFGFAYVLGGRSLWLPIAVHAAAVYVVEIARLYTVFRAPLWLIGHPEYPQGGLLGSVLIAWIAIWLAILI